MTSKRQCYWLQMPPAKVVGILIVSLFLLGHLAVHITVLEKLEKIGLITWKMASTSEVRPRRSIESFVSVAWINKRLDHCKAP